MTTCVWTPTMVAADTMADQNCLIMPTSKIRRFNNMILMGSGHSHQIEEYFFKIKNMNLAEVLALNFPDYEEEKKSPAMILVDVPNPHLAWYLVGSMWMRILRDFHAIGSGRDFAMAAIALGKNAREAVELAAQFDIYTGGDVECVQLKW